MSTGIQSLSEWERVELVLADKDARIIYFYGPPGTGKTYAAYHYGLLERGYAAVTLTPETSAAELRGHFVPRGGEVVWHDGPFMRAIRAGKRLVLNEISHAGGDVLALLFPILDSIETAEFTLPTGEVVRPAPGFTVIATDNYSPDDLPPALQDRFTCCLHVTKPHPAALACLSPELREIAAAALKIKDQRRLSARTLISLEIFKQKYGLSEACRIVMGPERGQMAYDAILLFQQKKRKGPKTRR